MLGAIAIGWPLPEGGDSGVSAKLPRRKPDEIIHFSKW